MSRAVNSPEQIRQSFVDHYARLKGPPVPPFRIEFYPYSNLNHTIRIRQGKVIVRISDLLADAPVEVVTMVVGMLLYKLFGRRVPPAWRRYYGSYVSRSDLRQRARQVQQIRGRKQLTSPAGKVYHLQDLFEEINHLYFGNQVQVEYLSWSPRRSRRVLGHYDAVHRVIIINRRLDHVLVPRYVVEYVLYHEMLHALLGDRRCRGRREVHHAEFRERERRYAHYRLALEFIQQHF